eukprot:5939557-Pyramimonas_sp.AAC.2
MCLFFGGDYRVYRVRGTVSRQASLGTLRCGLSEAAHYRQLLFACQPGACVSICCEENGERGLQVRP